MEYSREELQRMTKGRRDCNRGLKPQSLDDHYLMGYSAQIAVFQNECEILRLKRGLTNEA